MKIDNICLPVIPTTTLLVYTEQNVHYLDSLRAEILPEGSLSGSRLENLDLVLETL